MRNLAVPTPAHNSGRFHTMGVYPSIFLSFYLVLSICRIQGKEGGKITDEETPDRPWHG
jgi:hypothetical protein